MSNTNIEPISFSNPFDPVNAPPDPVNRDNPAVSPLQAGPLSALRPRKGSAVHSAVTPNRRGSTTSIERRQSFALSESKAQTIQTAVLARKDRELTDVETEITKTYVLPDHLRAITEAARIMNIAVSFRPAGPETLKWLKAGALPKPHDILEKTIKVQSMIDVYGDQEEGQRRFSEMQAHGIAGLIGHYGTEPRRLSGLYVDPSRLGASDVSLQSLDNGRTVFPLDDNKLRESLEPLFRLQGCEVALYTGDYDIHDSLNLGGRRAPHSEGQDTSALQALNCAIGAIDRERPYDDQARHVVQHGSQYNYVAHMKNHERDQPINERVATSSLPVAMCDRGTWQIIDSEDQLARFYKYLGITPKSDWASADGDSRRPSLSSLAGSPSMSRRSSLAPTGSIPSMSRRPSLVPAGGNPSTSRRPSLAPLPDHTFTFPPVPHGSIQNPAHGNAPDSYPREGRRPSALPRSWLQPIDGAPGGTPEPTPVTDEPFAANSADHPPRPSN
ncbi:hypothetical protein [Burkholderia sp. lyk4-R2A-23]|uniref:hypothetical protein n=1 Tax=Burkholderia sp. lyk4-R2A-23 TaxID=3040284 RepID=UPI0025510968|nr:hypothetical protein [Burkholderia sp. lyk4-R2A-23]